MAVIGIRYDEGNKKDLDYKHVRISYDNLDKEEIFNSGDFVKDWYDCVKFWIFTVSGIDPIMSFSSSVDHFIMDGAPYESAYLKVKDEKPYLDYEFDFGNQGTELFVQAGTQPTWEELRELCGDPKKEDNGKN